MLKNYKRTNLQMRIIPELKKFISNHSIITT